MEYTLRSGKKLTDKKVECLNKVIDAGNLSALGSRGEIVVGRPRLSPEPLVTITFKIPESEAARIKSASEFEGTSRSEFL